MFNLIKVMISRLASIGLGMVETKVSQHKSLTVFGKLCRTISNQYNTPTMVDILMLYCVISVSNWTHISHVNDMLSGILVIT